MLHQLRNKTIWRLKRLPVLDTAAEDVKLKNVWEEICWHYYGDSIMMPLWEEYIKATIAEQFEKLKEIDRFYIWLETSKGEQTIDEFMYEKFEAVVPHRYLDYNILCQEIWINNEDVYNEVYNLILNAANDYADLKVEWHHYD